MGWADGVSAAESAGPEGAGSTATDECADAWGGVFWRRWGRTQESVAGGEAGAEWVGAGAAPGEVTG